MKHFYSVRIYSFRSVSVETVTVSHFLYFSMFKLYKRSDDNVYWSAKDV